MTQAPNQFGIKTLFVSTTLAAIALWLILDQRSIAIVLCVSVLPAALTTWLFRRFRSGPKSRPNTRPNTLAYRLTFALRFVSLSLLFFVIYILSAGPAIYLSTTYLMMKPGDSAPELLSAFYEPLNDLNHPDNPCQPAMDWYIIQWQEAAGITRTGS